jgi:hypothetical protein
VVGAAGFRTCDLMRCRANHATPQRIASALCEKQKCRFHAKAEVLSGSGQRETLARGGTWRTGATCPPTRSDLGPAIRPGHRQEASWSS